ncbi:Oleoyl-acyl carrier protein thioesterase [Tripterygium wilfordii]|uniref:Acyl-[acyl-carrier-protein] hydrolase n=1 Tax=Tripterygium wilfordii TaxID=458696 RepID=A0A7J7DJ19_TRIWF|nr:oleoyl-acyl carrier protein thioesterase, chloroplastic-like [Tripterygium wilfordii]KAF5746298.1 Oleoyl-acyl carrier protein thioesterase [Tripterygium wilfordii]
MLKVTCNLPNQFQSPSLCGFLGQGQCKMKSVWNVVLQSSPATRTRAQSVTSKAREDQLVCNSGRLADQVHWGSLEADGCSYKEKFIVRCYELGINRTATVKGIANLLQEVGCNHIKSLGFSTDGFATTSSMRKLHLIWVITHMNIEIYKYPAWSDVVEIETRYQGEGRIGTRRDYILKDYSTAEIIGRVTSK